MAVEHSPEIARWLAIQDRLRIGWEALYRCTESLDWCVQAARRAFRDEPNGPGDDDWPSVAGRLQSLARAVVNAGDRAPLPVERGADGWGPPEARARIDSEDGGVIKDWSTWKGNTPFSPFNWDSESPPAVYYPGWTLAALTDATDGMLTVDHALRVASGGAFKAESPKQRWQAFDAGGPLTPIAHLPPGEVVRGASYISEARWGLTEADAERVVKLWAPYLSPTLPAVNGGVGFLLECPRETGLAKLAWKLVEEARQRAAERGRRAFVKYNGDEYAGASKVAPAAAWALGAYSEREVVELDGQRYATMHTPRVAGVVQGRYPGRRVVQLGFPFETQTAALMSLAANDTQFALSPLAGKLLVWLLCTVPSKGFGEPLEGLARTMHSHTKKFRPEYTPAVAAALREIRGLLVVFDDMSDAPLFDMRLPGALGSAPDPAGIVEVEWAPAMMRATNPFHHDFGEVLVNRSAIERMPLQHPLYLRAYTRAAGWWNDARMPSGTLPEYTRAELAREFNAMSVHAATDPGAGRRQKSKAVGAVEEALAWLEAQELAKLKAVGTGRHQRLIVQPSEAHVEAYRQRTKQGGRPDG